MQIVIDIPKEEYLVIRHYQDIAPNKTHSLAMSLINSTPLDKCDRCGGEIYPNTLCIECNDYLAKSVFAEEIKQEIEQTMGDFYYSEHDLGVRQGFRFAMEIIDKHIGKEQE